MTTYRAYLDHEETFRDDEGEGEADQTNGEGDGRRPV